MKSLKIKSYLIGFIVVMISLFSFNNNAYAYEVDLNADINYYINDLKETHDKYPNGLNINDTLDLIISKLKNNDNFDYLIVNINKDFNIYAIPKNLNINTIWKRTYVNKKWYYELEINPNILDNNCKKFNIRFLFNNDTNSIEFKDLSNNNSSLEEYLNYIDNWLKNPNYPDFWYTTDAFLGGFESTGTLNVDTIIYDTNSNISFNNVDSSGNVLNLSINGTLLENGTKLPTFVKYYNRIKITKTYANDLEGNDLYNIRADFADIYDESYTYQFKTDFFNDWVDITENIQTAAQEGFYIYDYSCYYNTNIRFRVLDSNGEVLDENSINVSELNNFGMQISHNFATDLEGRDIYAITIDLRNCWENSYKYQYSYDNKNFYNMDVSEENKIYYLNHGINIPIYFQILDSNNNILWNTKYNGPFDNINKNIELKEFTGTDQSGNKFIGFEADLSDYTQFSDIYNFKVIINGIQQDLKDVIAWNIRENQFDNYNIDFELYLDELLIEKFNYNPKLGFDSFDDKYNDIVNNEMEEEINNGDYTSIDGIFEAVKSFINAISDFINSFFKLIMVFFNRLNLWIKSAVIGIFIVMVVCRIIKAVRK